MKEDMTYDGKTLTWSANKFKATSGMLGSQVANQQHLRDHGPIPEGMYEMLAKEVGGVKSVNGNFVVRPGIETMPPNPQVIENWGNNRVFLRVISITKGNARSRGGFYVHDSHKGFTHGCIEVETKFFTELRKIAGATKNAGVLLLRVTYASSDSSTNGGTRF